MKLDEPNKKLKVVEKFDADLSTKSPLRVYDNYLFYIKSEDPGDGMYCTNLVTKKTHRCYPFTVAHGDGLIKINDKYLALYYSAYNKIRIFEVTMNGDERPTLKIVTDQDGNFERVRSLANGDFLSISGGKTRLLRWYQSSHTLRVLDSMPGEYVTSYKREGHLAAVAGNDLKVIRINKLDKFEEVGTYSIPNIDPALRKHGLFMYDESKFILSASRIGSNNYPYESYLIFYSLKDDLRELGRTENLTGEYGKFFYPISQ